MLPCYPLPRYHVTFYRFTRYLVTLLPVTPLPCYFVTVLPVTLLPCYLVTLFLPVTLLLCYLLPVTCYPVTCYFVTVCYPLPCYLPVTLLLCYLLPVTCYPVTLLPCYPVVMLPCYRVTVLPCYLLPVTLLPCYHVTVLPYYRVTLLSCCPVSLVTCYLTLVNCAKPTTEFKSVTLVWAYLPQGNVGTTSPLLQRSVCAVSNSDTKQGYTLLQGHRPPNQSMYQVEGVYEIPWPCDCVEVTTAEINQVTRLRNLCIKQYPCNINISWYSSIVEEAQLKNLQIWNFETLCFSSMRIK